MAASYMLQTRKSAYHDSCIPAERKAVAAAADTGKTYREAEYSNCDQVSQDTIWKQAVGAERRCLKNWDSSWGFLAEFDAQIKSGKRGNPKEKEPLPEKSNQFSENVPNTNSGNYGNRVNTELGASMQQMEYQFYSGGRRRKLGADMICY
ncbi:uncharacterized protein C2orf50-like isoform X2 [Mya arenaria]|uniref:uncharacterized protein C2orf50-like isoform X2 n=1 Tax=Mya arenaria TaxID=6604 RepID=UPI0022E02184|nr:uncharacterized protein C2orf50-like isoform X2 [Mya arenaria]XP_052763217.1 uncharacterized protein C2orf50-like isoform X2 [Mya arenaria]